MPKRVNLQDLRLPPPPADSPVSSFGKLSSSSNQAFSLGAQVRAVPPMSSSVSCNDALVIVSVVPGGACQSAGLRAGDTLVEVNGERVLSLDALAARMTELSDRPENQSRDENTYEAHGSGDASGTLAHTHRSKSFRTEKRPALRDATNINMSDAVPSSTSSSVGLDTWLKTIQQRHTSPTPHQRLTDAAPTAPADYKTLPTHVGDTSHQHLMHQRHASPTPHTNASPTLSTSLHDGAGRSLLLPFPPLEAQAAQQQQHAADVPQLKATSFGASSGASFGTSVEVTQLKSLLRKGCEAIADLKQQLREEGSRRAAAEDAKASLALANQALEEEVDQLKQRMGAAGRRHESLSAEVFGLRKQRDLLSSKVEDLEDRVAAAAQQALRGHEEGGNGSVAEDIERLTRDLMRLSRDRDAAVDEAERLRSQVEAMNAAGCTYGIDEEKKLVGGEDESAVTCEEEDGQRGARSHEEGKVLDEESEVCKLRTLVQELQAALTHRDSDMTRKDEAASTKQTESKFDGGEISSRGRKLEKEVRRLTIAAEANEAGAAKRELLLEELREQNVLLTRKLRRLEKESLSAAQGESDSPQAVREGEADLEEGVIEDVSFPGETALRAELAGARAREAGHIAECDSLRAAVASLEEALQGQRDELKRLVSDMEIYEHGPVGGEHSACEERARKLQAIAEQAVAAAARRDAALIDERRRCAELARRCALLQHGAEVGESSYIEESRQGADRDGGESVSDSLEGGARARERSKRSEGLHFDNRADSKGVESRGGSRSREGKRHGSKGERRSRDGGKEPKESIQSYDNDIFYI